MIDSKLIKGLIPFIGTLLIVFGYIKSYIIYNHFGVRIHNYLEFSEILTIFLSDIIIYCFIILLAFLLVTLLISKREISENTVIIGEIMNENSFWKRTKLIFKKYKYNGLWTIYLIFLYITSYIWFPEKLNNHFHIYYIFPSAFFFSWISSEFARKYKIIHNKQLSSSYLVLGSTVFLFLVFTIISAISEIKQIKRGNTIISFNYQNKTIKSDAENLYIGQTKNFIFIKNIENNEVKTYKNNHITFFKIKKK